MDGMMGKEWKVEIIWRSGWMVESFWNENSDHPLMIFHLIRVSISGESVQVFDKPRMDVQLLPWKRLFLIKFDHI